MATARWEGLVGPVAMLRVLRTEDRELNLGNQHRYLGWLLGQEIEERNEGVMYAGGRSEGFFMNESDWESSACTSTVWVSYMVTKPW